MTLQRLDTIAAKLVVRMPFIGTIFSTAERRVGKCGTAKVCGTTITFDPAFMAKLTDEEMLFVAAHEALHVAFLHSYRVGDRDMMLWNIAADIVINEQLIADGLSMPKGAVCNNKYAGWDAETVYADLVKTALPTPQAGWGDGEGDLEPADGGDSGMSEAEAQVQVSQIARSTFAAGDKSSLVQRVLGEVTRATVDWKEETRELLNDPQRNDYSYRRFSRRFISDGVYLPSLYSEEMGILGIGVDVSGSITESQLGHTFGELNSIVEDCKPKKVVVVYGDTTVNRVDIFEPGEPIVPNLCGGGGTDMRVIVDFFSTLEEPIAAVIIFTDMYTPFPLDEPAYPLVWGNMGGRRIVAPVGRTVEVRV